MIGAVILAAGASERMGRPKALLPTGAEGGETFLERLVGVAERAGLEPIRVVAGEHLEEIAAALPRLASLLVRNPNPELGQLSSLRVGLRALPEGAEGAVVFLVDHPLVEESTVALLLERFRRSRLPIVIPSYGGRRGHPVLFGRAVFAELFAAPLREGARFVVRGRPELVDVVEVDDPGVLADIDTPEQYEKMMEGDSDG